MPGLYPIGLLLPGDSGTMMVIVSKSTAAAIALVLGAALLWVSVAPARGEGGPTWLPLHIAARGEAWSARAPGTGPAWRLDYWKQANQVTFKLCGMFYGTGSVTLSYGDEGDEVFFSHPVARPLCVETETGYGGGSHPNPVSVYITDRGAAKGAVGVHTATLFVDSR
jgi:hypothetical protein